MRSLTLQSPAKLNLYLKVKNKRKDGFHNIETVFERINLCDSIRLSQTKGNGIKIVCNHPHVPTGPKNIAYKAAQLIISEAKVDKGIKITIKKNIPVAAGLGGGSSNAAAVLQGLNRLWRLGLSPSHLLRMAADLGSDVPFFLHDCPWALGKGRGERIEKLKIRAKMWHLLVVPRKKVYAREIYGGLKLQLTKRSDNARLLVSNIKSGNILGISRKLKNDLEPQVLRQCPMLGKLKERLKSLNIKGVMVTGSGPGVFGLTESEKEAQKAKMLLSRRYAQVFAVKTL